MQNYDNYIAVDWSMSNMAIARMTKISQQIQVVEQPTSLKELKLYLSLLKGTKALTIEESNCAQWLYTELHDEVDNLIICEPYRNRLLLEGPKNDRVDAEKLVKLLRNNLLKPVFHSGDKFIYMRKLTSHYQDLVKSGVKLKNQRSALFRSYGLDHKSDEFKGDDKIESFVLLHLDEQIEFYEQKKKLYEEKFSNMAKKLPEAKLLKGIPGIGNIHAIEILAAIVDAKRFPSKGHLLSYCGLLKHEKISGGRSYGKRYTNFHRDLKRVIKMATFAALRGCDNDLVSYYKYLITKKNYSEHNARHAVSRKIACRAYGILKSKTKYKPKEFEADLTN